MSIQERLLPLVSIFVWGSAFPLITFALDSFGPTHLVVLRLSLAAFGFLALFATGLLPFQAIRRRDLGIFVIATTLAIPIYHLSLTAAQVDVSPTSASIVVQTTALFAYAIAILTRSERLRPVPLLGSLLAFAGAVVVIRSGSSADSFADVFQGRGLLIWLAPLGLAGYTHLTRGLVARYGSLNLTGQTIILGAAISSLATIATPGLAEAASQASASAWIAVGFLALLSTVAGYLAWTRALEVHTATELSLYLYLSPLVSAAVSVLLVGERFSLELAFGSAAVLSGVVLARRQ